ncbi:MAG: ATP-binding cassette domain-containing protein [Methanomicrobiaceae archaeon]|nr:ATP-binding cassette domain-containing protein [Methanomicrobiaceae archaeon]
MMRIRGLGSGILSIPDLALPPGHTCIIGPNGSGKTTFLELCAGIRRPERGELAIAGRDPRDCDIGWVCQFPDRNFLFDHVHEEIASPLVFAGTDCCTTCREVDALATLLGIAPLLSRSIRALSGGEKAMVALAAALASSPRVLVLDEPDSHLDRRTARTLQEVIRDAGIPLVLQSTQDMETAASADMVVFLNEGRIVHAGPPEEIAPVLEGTCFAFPGGSE